MFGRLRNLILIVLAAAVGALVGRWIAEARSRVDAGEDRLAVNLHDLQVRPQDFVPGVVAAFRVGEPPWSWLHIPAWLAAFGTNFAAAAVGGDSDRLRSMAEDRALRALGLEADAEIEIEDVPTPPAPFEAPGNTSPPSPASPPPTSEPPAPPPPPNPSTSSTGTSGSGSSSAPSSHQPVWTTENAAPPATNGNGKAPEAEAPGFTPLRD